MDIKLHPDGMPIELWSLRMRDVIIDMLGDPIFDGHFAYRFKMERDSDGNRVFREPSGCLRFEEHARSIGPGVVPVALEPYLDGTTIYTNTPAKPLYSECWQCNPCKL